MLSIQIDVDLDRCRSRSVPDRVRLLSIQIDVDLDWQRSISAESSQIDVSYFETHSDAQKYTSFYYTSDAAAGLDPLNP